MRLVLATPLYPPEAGGPATFAKVLEEELPSRGWSVTTIKFRDVRHLPKILRHLSYAWRVYQFARAAERVLALDPVSVGLPALIAARLAGKPFYLRVAGDYAWEQGTQRWGVTDTLDAFVQKKTYALPVRFLQWLDARVARAAVRIIVPSEYLKRIVVAWGIDSSRIAVAYNAVPELGPMPEKPKNAPAVYLTTIARLVPWKGVFCLLEAMKRVPNTTLVIVGDGPERARLETLTRDPALAGRVIYTGSLPHKETLAWLAHARGFILNTRYEGFSHLILEALALGVPVATTAVGGNPELIRHEETGIVFPYDDEVRIAEAIKRLSADESMRDHMAKNGIALVSTFTRAHMLAGVLDALS